MPNGTPKTPAAERVSVIVRLAPSDVAALDAEAARQAQAGLMDRPDRSRLVRAAVRAFLGTEGEK